MKLSELKALVDAEVIRQAKFGNDPEVWYFDALFEKASRVTVATTMEGRSMEAQFANLGFMGPDNITTLPEDKLPKANHPLFLISNSEPDYFN